MTTCQRQRVSLARACYQRPEISLLDDPLGSVGQNLVQNVFDGILSNERGILGSTTRIMVTNNLTVLPSVDEIIVMDSSHKIVERGTYQHLVDKNGLFASLLGVSEKQDEFDGNRQKDGWWTDIGKREGW